jgi:hypothetical protein
MRPHPKKIGRIHLKNATDFCILMGGERLELSNLSVPHFECGASTNSAIRP